MHYLNTFNGLIVQTGGLTLRSVLRTQMKVQTEGLLLDFNTTNPPGPFSPLREREKEKESEFGLQLKYVLHFNRLRTRQTWRSDSEEVWWCNWSPFLQKRSSLVCAPPDEHLQSPWMSKMRKRHCLNPLNTSINDHMTMYWKYIRSKRKLHRSVNTAAC